ncbi:MAG TPA: AAA family ATPase [Candidatus Mediterraneibacter intestinipullorum]|nr:AAA family ATPase [Candidatus Mediterraneibacter intestinipullorum]
MQIRLKSLHLENFKGIQNITMDFSRRTNIHGANATGKTTIFDGFTWLLFNKDSTGNEKFDIRPLDAEGKRIDNVEIKVTALLDVDGTEVELSKVQKQNWVKKRGTDTVSLQGNINSFEVDGYPKLESDYKAYINQLIPEDLFKILTSPQYFAGMDWKKQRTVLMKLAGRVSDLEIAREDAKFALLIPELEKAPSTDDIRKKYAKALSEWKKRQAELPARIDEVSRQFVDVDVAELELYRNHLKEKIAEAEQVMDNSAGAYKEYQTRFEEVTTLRKEVQEYRKKAENKAEEQREKIRKKIRDCDSTISIARQGSKFAVLETERLERQIGSRQEEKVSLQNEWRAKKAQNYQEFVPLPDLGQDALSCPVCHREFQDDRREQIIRDHEELCRKHEEDYRKGMDAFELDKKKSLAAIEEKGNAVVETIRNLKAEKEQIQNQIAEHEKNIQNAETEKADLEKILSQIPVDAGLSDDQVFAEMQLRLSKMEEAFSGLNNGEDSRSQMKIRLSGLREELSATEQKIASSDNSKVEARIEELQEEQREVGQKVADQEQMLYLLDQFVMEKMQCISELINSKFDTVSWKLFDIQINGGVKECCECTVNGVPYSALNSGHRIVAGLDIIRSLSQLYEASAPIFIDNAESINEFNLPDMDAQMICLSVSEDRELKAEVE